MHIPDFIPDAFDWNHGGPVCIACEDRLYSGQRPPWQPDAIGRAAREVASVGWTSPEGRRLSDSAITVIALFLEPSDKP